MRIFPASNEARFALLLFPFKAYTLAAPIALFIFGTALPKHVGTPEAAANLVMELFFSALVLLVGGLSQFFVSSRRLAVASLAWAGASLLAGLFLEPMFPLLSHGLVL